MTANDKPVIAIDFETSGRARHLACAIGMARIEGHKIVDEYYQLIRPPSSQIFFTHIHGLCWQDLKDQHSFADIWPSIEDFISGASHFLAHNAPFDRSVLQGCCSFFHVPYPGLPFFCSLRGSRRQLNLRSNSLDNVCSFFNIPLSHHNAASDARGCAEIFLRLLGMGMDISQMEIG